MGWHGEFFLAEDGAEFRFWLDEMQKLTQVSAGDVAEALGVHRSTYSGWRTGRNIPQLDNAIALAAAHKSQLWIARKGRFDPYATRS